jgi:hypothetical protein
MAAQWLLDGPRRLAASDRRREVIKFTELYAGSRRPIWICPLQIISMLEGAKGGSYVIMRDECSAQLIDPPVEVQKQVDAWLRDIFSPDYKVTP